MISKKCKYAIHALVYMGKEPQEKFLIKDVSVACRIPKKFLEAILLDLKRAGILGSKQGKGGGYFMRRQPSEVNLAEVVRLFDGAIAAVPSYLALMIRARGYWSLPLYITGALFTVGAVAWCFIDPRREIRSGIK